MPEPTASPPFTATAWLVRHGETEWSANGRHTGRTDLPLTDGGRDNARGLAGPLAAQPFDLVLCSPRSRARETAALAGFPDPEIDDDLAEWDYGDYEGITRADIHATRPTWLIWTDGAPGGESPAEVEARADRVIARAQQTGGRCLLFAHSHVLRTLAVRWVRQPLTLGQHLPLDTAAVSVLGFDRGDPTIARWNSRG